MIIICVNEAAAVQFVLARHLNKNVVQSLNWNRTKTIMLFIYDAFFNLILNVFACAISNCSYCSAI